MDDGNSDVSAPNSMALRNVTIDNLGGFLVGQGVVNISDLLSLLGAFGCTCDGCP